MDFIAKTLIPNPANRPSAEKLLSHPWLKKMFKTQDLPMLKKRKSFNNKLNYIHNNFEQYM